MKYTANFQPEAWVNDCAIPVDPQGPTEWDCTSFVDDDVRAYLDECAERRNESLTHWNGVLDNDDVFKRDPAAPEWVREWRGPFTIRVTSSPTEYLVTWEMQIDADSPREAAEEALRIHRDPTSIATCFKVAVVGAVAGAGVIVDFYDDDGDS